MRAAAPHERRDQAPRRQERPGRGHPRPIADDPPLLVVLDADRPRLLADLQPPDRGGVGVAQEHEDRPAQRKHEERSDPRRAQEGAPPHLEPPRGDEVRDDRQRDQEDHDRPLAQEPQAHRRPRQERPPPRPEPVAGNARRLVGRDAVEPPERGVDRQGHEERERSVVAGLARLDHEEEHRRQHQPRRQPHRPPGHPPPQPINEPHHRQRRERRREPRQGLAAHAGGGHQRGDGPARQGGLLQSRSRLDVGDEPVGAVEGVERLGHRALLSLAPKLHRAEPAEEHGRGQEGQHDLGGVSPDGPAPGGFGSLGHRLASSLNEPASILRGMGAAR